MPSAKIVLALLSHPDDAEFTCAGTLALLRQGGWEVHIGTMTPGDCGSAELGPDEISAIRRKEAAAAAKILDGRFHCLECRDGRIHHDDETKQKAVALLREVRPSLVITSSPVDYLFDHEITSLLVRDAVFWSSVPNLKTEGFPPLKPMPHLYYVDAMEGKGPLGEKIEPTVFVDIGTVMEIKEKMLCCHASQRDWLLKQHGIDEYVHAMKDLGKKRGQSIGREYAEGFRQHLGHAYPQDNLLAKELGTKVVGK